MQLFEEYCEAEIRKDSARDIDPLTPVAGGLENEEFNPLRRENGLIAALEQHERQALTGNNSSN